MTTQIYTKFEQRLGMPAGLANAWLVVAVAAAISAIHFGIQPEWVRSGSPAWAVVSISGLVMLFAIRHWRHQRFQLTRLEYRCLVAWSCACLALTIFAGLNVVPQARWALIDERLAHGLALGPVARADSKGAVTAEPAPKPLAASAPDLRHESEEKLKAIKEDMERWGTLFAWLIAIVALVIAFVTTWVFGLAREVKEQLDATRDTLDQHAKYGQIRRDQLSISTFAQLLHLHSSLDVDKGYVDRMVVKYLMGVIQVSTDMLGQIPDVQAASYSLAKSRTALQAIFGRMQPDTRLRNALRDKVVPCLIEHHDAMNRVPALSSPQGLAAMEELATITRLCRAL